MSTQIYVLIIVYIGDQSFVCYLSHIMNETSNTSIIKSGTWLLGTLEANNRNDSILNQYNIQKTMVKLFDKWSQCSITANIIYVLSNMAKCDEETRINLLNENILQKLRFRLQLLYENESNNRYVLEIWQNSSFLIANMSLENMDYEFNNLEQQLLIVVLVQILNKGLIVSIELNNDEDNFKSLKTNMINELFINIFVGIIRIFHSHSYVADELFNSMLIDNGIILRSLIRCTDYPYYKVRCYAIRVLIAMVKKERKFAQKIIDYHVLNRIRCREKKSSHDEIRLLLYLLSYLSKYEGLASTIINDFIINEIINNGFECDNVKVFMASVHFFNNCICTLTDSKLSHLLLNFNKGKYIESVCDMLRKFALFRDILSKTHQTDIIECIKSIAKVCILQLWDSDLVIFILNKNNLLYKLQMLRFIDNDNIIKGKYLKQNGFGDATFYIKYLVSQCLKQNIIV